MKISTLIFFCFFISYSFFGQDEKETSSIVDEGIKLYKSEMASWYGTDIFLEKHPDQYENIGGYFSYIENSVPKCIFFSQEKNPSVICTISFDTTYNTKTAIDDNIKRDFTNYEKDIFTIRQKALLEISSDSMFKTYNNTDLNLIPIIDKNKRKVFVITGPKDNGAVLFGNDYVLSFDEKNNLTSKKQLHKSLIVSDLSAGKSEGKQTAGYHSHVLSDYITSTDICTLLLFEKYTTWEQHVFVSAKYISTWDCKKNQLVVLTKEAWDKVMEDQKKRKH